MGKQRGRRSGSISGKVTGLKKAVNTGKKLKKAVMYIMPVLNVISLLVLKRLMQDEK